MQPKARAMRGWDRKNGTGKAGERGWDGIWQGKYLENAGKGRYG